MSAGGGRERHVVDLARLGVEAAPDDALDELVVGHVQQQEGVGLDALLGDGVRLRRRSRVPVQEPPLFLRRGGVQRIHHHGDNARVRHEVTAVHVLLRLKTGGRALLDRSAEQVPGGDVHEAVLLDDELALRALAGGGRARDHHPLGAGADGHRPAALRAGRGGAAGVELSARELSRGGGEGERSHRGCG